MRKRSTGTVDSDEVFECIESYFTVDERGTPVLIAAGARYRASSGYPARNPSFWVPDGAAHDELLSARVARWAEAEAAAEARQPKKAAEPITVECVADFSLSTISGGRRLFKAGDRIMSDDPGFVR